MDNGYPICTDAGIKRDVILETLKHWLGNSAPAVQARAQSGQSAKRVSL
jgi:hypothetical protein